MQDVTVTFTDGPLRGQDYEFEVGHVMIGRSPGSAGTESEDVQRLELKGADTSVSRVHAELRERDGNIEVQNRSPNGTVVNGKLVLNTAVIQPNAQLQISNFPFTVKWTTFVDYTEPDPKSKQQDSPKPDGPLSSPIVRAVLGVYLLGMVGLAVWLMVSDDSGELVADDWPMLVAEYENYEGSDLPEDLRAMRLEKAEGLVRELRLQRVQGYGRSAETICRELMSIDGDSRSPIYRYGAQCLGSL